VEHLSTNSMEMLSVVFSIHVMYVEFRRPLLLEKVTRNLAKNAQAEKEKMPIKLLIAPLADVL